MGDGVARATVRFWLHDEGWGVLDSPTTPGGCWAHYSAIDIDGYRSLEAGQSTEFTYEGADQDGYDWRAVSIRPDGAGSSTHREAPATGAYRSTLDIQFDATPGTGTD
jgi:CspA family cold shock protein